jgi:hypothetical protein
LENPGEENMGFLAPGAHELLKVRQALKYGVGAGRGNELANAAILRPVLERGAEEGDEGEVSGRDLQRVEVGEGKQAINEQLHHIRIPVYPECQRPKETQKFDANERWDRRGGGVR